jgi:polysaccharide export outer membrane protein
VLVAPEPGQLPDDLVARTIEQVKEEGEEVYRLGLGDGVSINVSNYPDFSTGSTIRPDGRITIPLIGDVEIVDLTPQEVSEKVKLRLQDYVKQDLLITTAVTRFSSQKYYVFGEVGRPGRRQYTGRVSLIDAVTVGGYNRIRADLDNVIVYRNGRRLIMPHRKNPWWRGGGVKDSFDIEAVMSNGNLSDNVIIKANDIIYVPPTLFAKLADVVDEVLLPLRTVQQITNQATQGISIFTGLPTQLGNVLGADQNTNQN